MITRSVHALLDEPVEVILLEPEMFTELDSGETPLVPDAPNESFRHCQILGCLLDSKKHGALIFDQRHGRSPRSWGRTANCYEFVYGPFSGVGGHDATHSRHFRGIWLDATCQ
jgi:hypothetical protein